MSELTLRQLQAEAAEWAERNFPGSDPAPWQALLGVVEESGELTESYLAALLELMVVQSRVGRLAHAYLKQSMGIRGGPELHKAKMQDAVGDTVIFLAQFCTRMGFDLQGVVEGTWQEVQQRDWRKNPNGDGYGEGR